MPTNCTRTVEPHPSAKDLLGGQIKCSVDVGIDVDLNTGDRVRITVSTADGEVLGACTAEVQSVGFPVVRDRGDAIGQYRAHKAKVVL